MVKVAIVAEFNVQCLLWLDSAVMQLANLPPFNHTFRRKANEKDCTFPPVGCLT
jgi:hypothetical protein